MSLPFQPETEAQIKKRLSKALTQVVDADACASGFVEPPGRRREHVFDFTDRTRMIASLETSRGTHYVHLSFSTQTEIKNEEEYKAFWESMRERALRMFGKIKPFQTGVTPAAIHFLFSVDSFKQFVPKAARDQIENATKTKAKGDFDIMVAE